MNRLIKFRVWNITDSVMVTDLNSPRLCHGVLVFDVDDITMQYTGLKDKNDIDIYEGDIVKESPLMPRTVIYENEGYTPFTYSGGGETDPDECEVIGNIYENPELLGDNHA